MAGGHGIRGQTWQHGHRNRKPRDYIFNLKHDTERGERVREKELEVGQGCTLLKSSSAHFLKQDSTSYTTPNSTTNCVEANRGGGAFPVQTTTAGRASWPSSSEDPPVSTS